MYLLPKHTLTCNISAIIVVINSILQIVLYAPMALFFVNVISGESEFRISYGAVAIDVLIVSLWYCLYGDVGLHLIQS